MSVCRCTGRRASARACKSASSAKHSHSMDVHVDGGRRSRHQLAQLRNLKLLQERKLVRDLQPQSHSSARHHHAVSQHLPQQPLTVSPAAPQSQSHSHSLAVSQSQSVSLLLPLFTHSLFTVHCLPFTIPQFPLHSFYYLDRRLAIAQLERRLGVVRLAAHVGALEVLAVLGVLVHRRVPALHRRLHHSPKRRHCRSGPNKRHTHAHAHRYTVTVPHAHVTTVQQTQPLSDTSPHRIPC